MLIVVQRISGILALGAGLLVTLAEWGGGRPYYLAAAVPMLAYLAIVTPGLGRSRQLFVLIGAGLVAAAAATRPDWQALTERALRSAAFVTAFFVALAWLRSAAGTSPAIARCGRFLAEQPPGRRYAALTMGGHLFGLMLSYGTISLLGSLAEASARTEPNAEVRRIRTRRMLLAVQRGFVGTLSWSPLTFSLAITTTIVPGASWAGVAGYGFAAGLALVVLGWVMDALYKPRLSGPRPPPRRPAGSWMTLQPLAVLLALLMGSVGAIHLATGLRAVAVVMVVVPLLSLVWIAVQSATDPAGRAGATLGRVARFVCHEVPAYNSEIVLLIMAGFIGTAGAALLVPVFSASGIDLTVLPATLVLVGLVWLVPLTGQMGMNPILTVSLIAPLLPAPAAFGVAPEAMVLALIGGWALSGASSPFTATTLLLGAIGGVSAARVGVIWNGLYTLIGGCLLSLWVVGVANWI